MTEIKVLTQSGHLANKAGFTFFQDKIISVGEDCIMQIYDTKLNIIKKIDLDKETYTVASNSIDKIAIGGEALQVDVHTIADLIEGDNVLGNPFLAMKFETPITRIQWTGKYILGYSEDSHLSLFNTETEKVIHFRPGHDGSIKNGAMDPLGELIATTGCDGMLHVYKVPQSEEEEVQLLKKHKIYKKNIQSYGFSNLDVAWTPDGSQLFFTGDTVLGIMNRSTFEVTFSKDITHDKEITTVTWLNDYVFATAGLEKTIKIWDSRTMKLMNFIKSQCEVLSIQYCQKNKCLVYLDFESNLGIWEKEFEELTSIDQQAQASQGFKVDDDMKDEDLDNFIFEENQIANEANIALQSQNQQVQQINTIVLQNDNASIVSQTKSVTEVTKTEIKMAGNGKAGRSLLETKEVPEQTLIKQAKTTADDIIGVEPSNTFIPNCHYDFEVGKYRILSWNMIGTVALREEFQFTSIDVEFTNKSFHRNLVINDDYHVQMAALNYSGMLIASKAQESDLDNYEEDDDEDMENLDGQSEKRSKKNSHIYFKPFNEWKNLKDWHFELKDNESVDCLALGTGWCAALTDFGYIRVFSTDGVQKYIMSQGRPVVSMAGYENILSVVYHAGPPILGFQSLKVKQIDMSNKSYKIIVDTECPISRNSNLIWIGYSEEGQLFTFDNEGIMRAFNPSNFQWVPVIDFKLKYPYTYSQLWIVGICDNEILAIEMAKNYPVPHMHQKSQIRRFKLKIPLLAQEQKDVESKEMTVPQIEENLMRDQFNLDFETFRKDKWESLKQFRNKHTNEYVLSENIMSTTDLTNKKKEMDKLVLNAIRLCIVNDDYEKVFTYMDMLYFAQSLKLCVKLCEQLNVPDLAQKVNKYLQDKEMKDMQLETYKKETQKTTGHILEKRIMSQAPVHGLAKEKYDLSAFAINTQESVVTSTIHTQQSVTAAQVSTQEQQRQALQNLALAETEIQKPKASGNANPFAKKTTIVGTQKTQSTDVFKDLTATTKAPTQAQKRPNPFADNKPPSKQRKLK